MQGSCTPPFNIPEQINLQLAAHDVIVAAFVSYHGDADAPRSFDTPVALIGKSADPAAMAPVSGVFHSYTEPIVASANPDMNETGRNYTMSFVRFNNLNPRTRYYYKVKGPGYVLKKQEKNPFLPRICAWALVRLLLKRGGGERKPSVTPRCGSLQLSAFS